MTRLFSLQTARRTSQALRVLARIVRQEVISEPGVISKAPSLKSQLIEEAAIALGYTVTRLHPKVVLVEVDDRLIPFQELNGPTSSVVGKVLCDNKHYARKILRTAGLSVVTSAVVGSVEEAQVFAGEVGFPVVVKPLNQARGRGVTTGIQNHDELRQALQAIRIGRKPALVEQHFVGDDYRFFVVGDTCFSVTKRVRAHVVGDGRRSVQALIDGKNEARRQNRYLRDYLIPDDPSTLTALTRAGRRLSDVPAVGERVWLRDTSNLSGGGDSIDVTDACHPSFKEIAIRAVNAIPGMTYAGVDILAPTVEVPATGQNHVVGEVEYSPAPITNYPVEGVARDMAAAILEYYVTGSGGNTHR